MDAYDLLMMIFNFFPSPISSLFLIAFEVGSAGAASLFETPIDTIDSSDFDELTISSSTDTQTFFVQPRYETHSSNTQQHLLTQPQLFDVWIHEIGPKLDIQDIVELSLVNKWARHISHNINPTKQPKDTANIKPEDKEKMYFRISEEAVRTRVCIDAWSLLRFELVLGKWSQNNNTHCNQHHNNNSNKTNDNHTVHTTNHNSHNVYRNLDTNRTHVSTDCENEKWCDVSSLVMWGCVDVTDFSFVQSRRLEQFALQYPRSRLDKTARQSLESMLLSAPRLTSLTLSKCIDHDDDMAWLERIARSHLTHLTHFCLDDNKLSADRVHHVLSHTPHLTSLSLGGNDFGCDGMSVVCRTIREMKTLKTLSLHNNNIGTEGARCVGPALMHLPHVTSVNLWANNLGSEGVGHMLPWLLKPKQLAHLNLAWNEVDDAMKAEVKRALPHVTQLKLS